MTELMNIQMASLTEYLAYSFLFLSFLTFGFRIIKQNSKSSSRVEQLRINIFCVTFYTGTAQVNAIPGNH